MLTILHMIVYFPGDYDHAIYESLSILLLKFPTVVTAVDKYGKTPLHHAVVASQQHNSMSKDCFDQLQAASPNTVVHQAIRAKINWHHLHQLVKGKINTF